jgi:(1->4)-alpha-D-glucan 1-alpha-D-glucosylmutase
MPNISLLDRLCALFGIDIEYTDVWGKRHQVSDDTKQRLLDAMGIDIRGNSDLAGMVEEAEARTWRCLLMPVQVLIETDDTFQTVLSVPLAKVGDIFRWRLTLESGEIIDRQCRPIELAVIEKGNIADELFVRYALPLPSRLAIGYHSLKIEQLSDDRADGRYGARDEIAHDGQVMSLIVVPATCYLPPALEANEKVWGPAIQLYAVRSQRNWGMGDFGDLRSVVKFAAESGASFVGSNPLHALFPRDPAWASPYSPSSRNFLNVLYLDPEAVEDFAECEPARRMVEEIQFQAKLRALRAVELVNYREVGALKLTVLEILYGHFQRSHIEVGSPRAHAFRSFQEKGGLELRQHALFEALQEHFSRIDSSNHGWTGWPEDYHDPDSRAVRAFAATHEDRIDFYTYLQWLADLQLAGVAHYGRERGLKIGLYQDVAVGIAADGAESWAGRELNARRAHIGAPPDEFNRMGQDWGLLPLIPERLRDAAYRPFITTLRKNMQHAGALRLDHVMGLMRLFWVPGGADPSAGAYVQYPFADLIGIVALESQRNRCLVIGEDLGTVPPEVSETLKHRIVLSYRLFYFEKESDGAAKAAAHYPANALVAVGTHDLPTLFGYWQDYDLDLRGALGLFPSDQVRDAQMAERAEQRHQFLSVLEQAGLLPLEASTQPFAYHAMTAELVQAIHLYIAHTPAKVMAVQMEDVFGQLQQVNLPASGAGYPNWQRKLPYDVEDWAEEPRLQALVQALREARGSGVEPAADANMQTKADLALPIPSATYRLQFNSRFTFTDAEQLIPYLHALGVSHCYASPYFKARTGSMHGYDVTDHRVLNPEIGTDLEFDRYVDMLRRHGMGQILDLVPNHMAVTGSDNAWWLDILENGRSSRYAEFFDINWQPQTETLRNKVLLPILGEQYGAVLEKGGLSLVFDKQLGEFSIWYESHRFPVDPREYPRVLSHHLPQLTKKLGHDLPQIVAFESLVTAFSHLPLQTDGAVEMKVQRERDKQIHKQRLAGLCESCPEIFDFIQDNVGIFNGESADPKSFDLLHQLIEVQAYRLAYWRLVSDEINYRRFADITTLAGLRIECEEVFNATHRLAMELVAEGKIDGLRIDHTDGLFDPLQYFQRLQQAHRLTDRERHHHLESVAGDNKTCYVVIEKILAEHERLPSNWPIHGTTGYDFANTLNGLFVDRHNEKRMDRIYAVFIDKRVDFSEILYNCKKYIAQTVFASELNALTDQLSHIAQMDRHTQDFSHNILRDALVEIVACLPVYRTYVTGEEIVSQQDRNVIEEAVSSAKKKTVIADVSVLDFVRGALLVELMKEKGSAYQEAEIKFAMHFQQFSSPVMAKGMEDTSFYIYHRLTSLNEVGCDPSVFGISVDAFHASSLERAKNWPHTMVSTSTHDTKRSEDVRARINVLSEFPALWRLRLRHWTRINQDKKSSWEWGNAPSRNDEYLLYQTLIGCWPLEPLSQEGLSQLCERIEAYMLKAVREAKQITSWVNPDLAYENALSEFIRALLAPSKNNAFLSDFLPFQQLVSRLGMFNSLSQILIKFTTPGVPDIYQGNELWNFSLVDPDNRKQVDYHSRRLLLDELQHIFREHSTNAVEEAKRLLMTMEDGRIKLYLTWKSLQLRRRFDDLFRDGDYVPLHVDGVRSKHVCAFARRYREQSVVIAVPRLLCSLIGSEERDPIGDIWEKTYIDLPETLNGTRWENVLTGELLQLEKDSGYVALSRLFAHFPYALLVLLSQPAST